MGILVPFQTAGLKFFADDAQRAHPRVADIGKNEFFRAACCHHLVVDQVGGCPCQGKILPTLADDLVSGRKWDQMGEAGAVDRVTIVDFAAIASEKEQSFDIVCFEALRTREWICSCM